MMREPGRGHRTHGPLMESGIGMPSGVTAATDEHVVGEPGRADDGAHPGPVAGIVADSERIKRRVLAAVGCIGSFRLPAAATITASLSTAA